MILTKQQINRYMRHIIMPEISGSGQKRLLNSAVYMYGETVKDASPLIYYLAASGIGSIFCNFEVEDNYETLFHNIRDLNDDILIELANDKSLAERKCTLNADSQGDVSRVYLGSAGFINRSIGALINIENEKKFIPTIIAMRNQWIGTLQNFDKFDEFKPAAEKLSDILVSFSSELDKTLPLSFDSNTIATSILGALCSSEVIKHSLRLGEVDKSMLYFDVFSMEFSKIEHRETDKYIDKLLNNNFRNTISFDNIEKKLSDCRVLIVGTGGLGAPVAFALAMSGIGTIGLVDYDTVEISNLNRQILHSTSRIGMQKVKSAKVFLNNINPAIKVNTHNISFSEHNAMEVIKDYDIIVDGLDNFPTRYLLNDACFFAKKPMIEAGVIRLSGLNTTIIPGEGHCYRCAFPNIPKPGSSPSCSESGVLGPIPGVMGFIQAAEVIKMAIGQGQILKNKLLYFDAQDMEFTIVELDKNPNCPLCGEQASINSLQGYEFTCETNNN